MPCDNIFCIFWSSSHCRLPEASFDRLGNCCNYIPVEVDEQILEPLREKRRAEYFAGREVNYLHLLAHMKHSL